MLQKVGHSLLALWLVLGSGGLLFSRHYCGEELKDIALYTQADACPMHQPMPPDCPFHNQEDEAPAGRDCCADEISWVQTDEFTGNGALDFWVTLDLSPLPILKVIPSQSVESSIPARTYGEPPPVPLPLYAQFQVFRV